MKYRVTLLERTCSMHVDGLDIRKHVFELEAISIEEAIFKVLGRLSRVIKIDIEEANLVLNEDDKGHIRANWKDIEEE